ncbi:MAG: anaerobic glycerol-3-phosphate dehydrogenase subunit A [Chloroflexi bacterium]|nr:anaerobic glycerol-3-phosphate dehydrogenase subunit A [Chloroflexota bacterium]
MQKFESRVIVVGGGVTGTGVLRDLAMRGANTLLFERDNLAAGTSGNFHGLLHSGGRYAVTDPTAAVECIQENTILRRIAPQAIEDTGGFFVVMDDVDEAFLPKFVEGCARAGIPTEAMSGDEARKLEPDLSPAVRQAVTVPDASVDGYTLCAGNVASARALGSRSLLYTTVTEVLREGKRVVGVRARDKSGEEIEARAEIVVNATGAWSGRFAQMAGVTIKMTPNKGAMIVLDGRPMKRVINRCRKPGDGDIVVPVGTTVVLGTTSVNIEDPDHYKIEEWEIDKILTEGIEMVPKIEQMRMQRTYGGVRPLYKPPSEGGDEGREISRSFFVLDHAKLDGVEGLISIVGGKLTTYRQMAERTADAVCAKLGVAAPCRTADEPLPTGA